MRVTLIYRRPETRNEYHYPHVVVTLHPRTDPRTSDVSTQEAVIQAAVHLASQFDSTARSGSAVTAPTHPFKMNVYLHHGDKMLLQSLPKYIEGVDITMARCEHLDEAVESTARFLTLRLPITSDMFSEAKFKMAAGRFPQIADLRLMLECHHTDPSPEHLIGYLQIFQKLTSLSLRLPAITDLDLTALEQLHTLHIQLARASGHFRFPGNLQSISFEATHVGTFTLSEDLHTHLHALPHLTSIAINSFELSCGPGVLPEVLPYFPATLRSLSIQGCSLHHSVSLGRPHGALKELQLGHIEASHEITKELGLRLLSCKWGMLKGFQHAHHLRVLWISHVSDPSHPVNSLKDFASLTELWIPMACLTQAAIKKASTAEGISDVLPLTLEVLVLASDGHSKQHETSWHFRSLRLLRSLGLYNSKMMIEPTKLPPFLRTLAISPHRFKLERDLLEITMTMTRLAVIRTEDWRRGPLSGRVFSPYSEDTPSGSLHDLEERQRIRHARHHQARHHREQT